MTQITIETQHGPASVQITGHLTQRQRQNLAADGLPPETATA